MPQSLHVDGIWKEPHDPSAKYTMKDYPVPVVTINFLMSDLTPENGPIRQICLGIGETVILLHPHLPLVGVSTGMERECQRK